MDSFGGRSESAGHGGGRGGRAVNIELGGLNIGAAAGAIIYRGADDYVATAGRERHAAGGWPGSVGAAAAGLHGEESEHPAKVGRRVVAQ